MRLTVLGSSGSYPGQGVACSGFLVESGDARIVVDLGWGTLPRLFDLIGNHTGDGIGAIAVTHEHPDHMADLYGLFRARWYGRRGAPPIPLLTTAGVIERLAGDHDGPADDLHAVFAVHPAPGPPMRCAGLTLSTSALPHYVPSVGVRIDTGGPTVAFSGDCGPSDHLVELGDGADLFVVEATDRHQQPGVAPAPPGTPEYNLSARQAGELAHRARVRTLLLSHFWPGNDRELSRREAGEAFGGPVLAAVDGQVVDVP